MIKSITKKIILAGVLTICLIVPILSSTKVSSTNNGITVYDLCGDVSENY